MGRLGTRARAVLDEQFVGVVLVLLVVAALGGWVTYTTHVEPGTQIEERQGPTMEETGTYSHQATVVEENPVFAAGSTLENRSVYYTDLTPVLDGSFAYSYAASEGGNLETRVTLDLLTRSVAQDETSGERVEYWRISEEVGQAERTLQPGQRVAVSFSRNVSELAAREERLQEQFGGPGTVETVVVAEVTTSGTVNGEAVEQTRQYRLPIRTSETVYRVDDPGPVTNATTSTEEVVVQNTYGPLRSIGGPALLAFALLLLLGLVVARSTGRLGVSEAERNSLAFRSEREEFDDWITVGHVPDDALEGPRIDVDSLEGLVDVAIDTDERVVEDGERGLYVVLGQGRHYAYEQPGTRMLGPERGDTGEADESPDEVGDSPDGDTGPLDDPVAPGGGAASTDDGSVSSNGGLDAAGGAATSDAAGDTSQPDGESDDEPLFGRPLAPFRRAREVGPVFLIPAAWAVVAAATLGGIDAVTEYTLFVAHVVMTVMLLVFAVTGYADMREGTLQVWWTIIAAGFFAAAAGTAGLRLENPTLQAVALYGWMLLPAPGLVYTGRRVTRGSVVYLGGAVLCVVGAAVYAAAPVLSVTEWQAVVAGIAAVGVGQTISILHAAVRY